MTTSTRHICAIGIMSAQLLAFAVMIVAVAELAQAALCWEREG